MILIVNEHEWASRSLDTVLAPRGYAILRAYNAEQAVERAAASKPDAVFIERSLPDAGGAELCRRLQEESAVSPATPLILTTSGPVTQEQRLEALRAGAWEIIALPVDAEELLLRLSRYTRAKLEADRAEESGRTDPETGFYNNEGILQRAHELMAAAERYGRPMACVVFEPTGDESGGDRDAIREIVEILRRSTRRSDIIGRIGPGQFAIVAPDTAPGGAEVLANRLRDTVVPGGPGARARAGAFGVDDPKATRIDPRELVQRAMTAAREPGSPGLN